MSRPSLEDRDSYRYPEESLRPVKVQLCKAIARAHFADRRDAAQLARRLGTSLACVSRVLNEKVDELTINQLFRYLAVLRPDFKILISIN